MKKDDLHIVTKWLTAVINGKLGSEIESFGVKEDEGIKNIKKSLFNIHQTLNSHKNEIKDLKKKLAKSNTLLADEKDRNVELKSTINYYEKRLNDIVGTSIALAQLDFSQEFGLSKNKDEFDGLALTLNMLREELVASTVSKRYLHDIFNSMGDMVIVIDHFNCIKSVNDSVTRELEYSAEELTGQKLDKLFDNNQSHFLEVEDINHVHYFKTKSGGQVPVEVQISTMNNLHGTVCIARNIVEKMQAAKQQQELLENLKKTNAELEEFAYILSHDLKSPLRGISTLAEWVYKDNHNNLDESSNSNLGLILNRAKRLYKYIEGVFEYAKVGRVVNGSKKVNLNELLEEVIGMLEIPSNVSLVVDNTFPEIEASRIHLIQLFQNLISNAIKYNDKSKGKINIGFTMQDGTIQYYVKDNGIGVNENQYNKIFNIFYTVHSKDEIDSTGIGLAIVKKVVNFYNGNIQIESIPGKGSTFFFSLGKKDELVQELSEVLDKE